MNEVTPSVVVKEADDSGRPPSGEEGHPATIEAELEPDRSKDAAIPAVSSSNLPSLEGGINTVGEQIFPESDSTRSSRMWQKSGPSSDEPELYTTKNSSTTLSGETSSLGDHNASPGTGVSNEETELNTTKDSSDTPSGGILNLGDANTSQKTLDVETGQSVMENGGYLESVVQLGPIDSMPEQEQTCKPNEEDSIKDGQSTDDTHHPTPIIYEVMYWNRGKPFYFCTGMEEEPVIKTLERTEVRDRLIEIRTTVESVVGSDGKVVYDVQPDGQERPKVKSIQEVLMTIYAPELVDAIRQIVLYYPSEAISNAASVGFMTIRKPYHVLQLYRDELAKLRASYDEASSEDPEGSLGDYGNSAAETESQESTLVVDPQIDEDAVKPEDFDIHAAMKPLPKLSCDRKLYQQLLVLENILDKTHKTDLDNEKLCHQSGTANFDMLWYLFQAGNFIYTKIDDHWAAAVVYLPVRVKLDDDDSPYKRNGIWKLVCWYLGFDGKKVRRIQHDIIINAYNGAREITSLPAYPIRFVKNADLQRLVDNGKTYYKILVKKYCQMHYRGQLLQSKVLYNGRVMIDPGTASLKTSSPTRPFHLYEQENFMNLIDNTRGDGILGKKHLWEGFDDIDPEQRPELTNRHYILLPRVIRGFALQRRKWESFDIENFTACECNPEELEELVLGKEQKDIIKALSQSAQAVKGEPNDKGNVTPGGNQFVDGRREGRIFLLHGPSGVGKTFTAECVAISTGRPLISLTCAELGTEETRIEATLGIYFMLAKAWDAIIVIDEADVYVEGRGMDFKRGNLVAAFLRSLETFRNEYHGGIIFLTTNRILKIDLAVRSRVHIPIYYSPLGKQARKDIYSRCVTKLQKHGFKMPESTSFLQVMEEMKWNGREISNSLQTIAALAEYDHPVSESLQSQVSIEITEKHIKPVLEQLKGFTAYFMENEFSECDVAKNKGERQDDWRWKDSQLKELKEEEDRAKAEHTRAMEELAEKKRSIMGMN